MFNKRPAVTFAILLCFAMVAGWGALYVLDAREIVRVKKQNQDTARAEALLASQRHEKRTQTFWNEKTVLLNALRTASLLEESSTVQAWDQVQTQLSSNFDDERLSRLASESYKLLCDTRAPLIKIRTYQARLKSEPDLREVLLERIASFNQDAKSCLATAKPRFLSLSVDVAAVDPPAPLVN